MYGTMGLKRKEKIILSINGVLDAYLKTSVRVIVAGVTDLSKEYRCATLTPIT